MRRRVIDVGATLIADDDDGNLTGGLFSDAEFAAAAARSVRPNDPIARSANRRERGGKTARPGIGKSRKR